MRKGFWGDPEAEWERRGPEMSLLRWKGTWEDDVLLLQFFEGLRIRFPAPFVILRGRLFPIWLTLKSTGSSPVTIQVRIQKTDTLFDHKKSPCTWSMQGLFIGFSDVYSLFSSLGFFFGLALGASFLPSLFSFLSPFWGFSPFSFFFGGWSQLREN